MDSKPFGGRGRGRGKEKSSALAPLEQLTLEEKEKDKDETLKSVNENVDDMPTGELKKGSPRSRGIGRGRGETRRPSRTSLEHDNETRAPPVLDDKYQDKEEIPGPSEKAEKIVDQVYPVPEAQKAFAGESRQEYGKVPQISEVQEAVAGESSQEDVKAPQISEVQDAATGESRQEDGKARQVFVVQEAVAGESQLEHGKARQVSVVQEAVAGESQLEHGKARQVSVVQEAVAGESQLEHGDGQKLVSASSGNGVETLPEEKSVPATKEKAQGVGGDRLEMKINCFIIKLRPGHTGVAKYHVSTTPVVEHLDMIRSLLKTEEALDFVGKMQILDGKVLYLFTILPDNDVVSFRTNFEENEYTVSLELMDIKSMQESTIFINTLLGKLLSHFGYKKTVEHYYDPTMEKILPNHRVCIWPGIDLTAEFQDEMFKVNVECTRLTIQQDNVLEQLVKLRGDPQMRSKFEKLIIGKIVITKYNFKYYKIMNVAWDLQPCSTFVIRGQKITFKDQVSRQSDITITEDDQPMLITKLNACGNDACQQCRGKRIIGLVPELCYIVGLIEEQASKLHVTTELMETTNKFFENPGTNPAGFVNRVLGNEEIREVFRHCGLHLSSAEDKPITPSSEAGQDV